MIGGVGLGLGLCLSWLICVDEGQLFHGRGLWGAEEGRKVEFEVEAGIMSVPMPSLQLNKLL